MARRVYEGIYEARPVAARNERPVTVRQYSESTCVLCAASLAPRVATRPRPLPRDSASAATVDLLEDDGPPIVGLGDHVPSFLLRPVVFQAREGRGRSKRGLILAKGEGRA